MIIVLKVLNPWLKGVVRGRQGLADFWMKPWNLIVWKCSIFTWNLPSFPFFQAAACGGFGTWHSSHRAFAVPLLANLQGQLILTWKRAASITSCALSHTSSSHTSLLFYSTGLHNKLFWGINKFLSVCDRCTCPPKLFFRGFQIKRAEKPLQLAFKFRPALLYLMMEVSGELGAAPCPLSWHWKLFLKQFACVTLK